MVIVKKEVSRSMYRVEVVEIVEAVDRMKWVYMSVCVCVCVQVHVAAEHPRQRREGLCVPRHLSDDPGEPGGRGARLHVLLRRGRVLVAPERRPQGHVHEDPARVQEPGRRRELAPVHRPVSGAAERAPFGHVRDIDTITSLRLVSCTSLHSHRLVYTYSH